MAELYAYLSLFILSFVAATILPAQSEIGLAAMVASQSFALPLLIFFASTGNVLGATVNWYLGWRINDFRDRKWFPATPDQLARAQLWYEKWGRWSLLLSWMPVIGDPITLVAGVMREPLARFLLIVTIAKTMRYCAVVYLALQAI